MDSAKNFYPEIIYLWDKICDNFEAQKIISLFKDAKVQILKSQKLIYPDNLSIAGALKKSKKILMLGNTSSFVNHFDGHIGTNMRCFSYYKLIPLSNGCPYKCIYCYLAYIYRKYGAFIKINLNYSIMFKQIQKISLQPNKTCLNFGEMLDSLALDHITQLSTNLIPFFQKFNNCYLMMLTKSSNIENLLKLKPNNQVIISWSLNPQNIIDQYEYGTASLEERINAAKLCQQQGYRIRFRIDPGILIHSWKNDYASLINTIFNHTEPENITLGTLRLFKAHISLSKKAYNFDTDLFSSLTETGNDGKLRYKTDSRVEYYKFLIDIISSYGKNTSVGVCREDEEIHEKLNCKSNLCNCIA